KLISTTFSSDNSWNNYFNSVTTIKRYSSVLNNSTSLSNGVKTKISYKDHDVLIGTPRTIITENSFGDRHRAKTIYAHEVDEYSEMGPKSENINNKNMLTQEAGSYLYYDNGNTDYTDDPVLNASITTWKKNWDYREWFENKYQTTDTDPIMNSSHIPVWRKKTTYSWRSKLDPETGAYRKTDGLTLFDEEDEFEFDNEASYENNHSGWVKNSEVTLYDHYSNPREVKDVNGQYASSKTWRGLTVSNIVGAAYSEYCSSSSEEVVDGKNYSVGNVYFETETMQGGGSSLNTDSINSHTGSNSVKVTNTNVRAFESKFYINADKFEPNSTYLMSVWVKGNIGNNANHIALKTYTANASSPTSVVNPEIIQAGDWYQLRYTFNLPNVGTYNSLPYIRVTIGSANYSGDLYFDDYRLYPIGASMTSYVYDDQDRIQYILDGNNLATKYKYDGKGRLKAIYTEKVGADGGFVKSADSKYHMIRDNE
ncbi:MAG: carbohydrate binding domain-containing protein, partial [Flavobacteriales bacterium]